jgi:ADP-heptose:LPS heptosyltransferase
MRVLVYRALGLGDFLTGVPAYRAVARFFAAYDVCVAAPEALRPLAALTGAVGTFLPTTELAPPPWDGPPPEVAVNLHGSGPQSHRVLREMNAGRLIAFRREDLGVTGPAWRADEHEVARWCRLLTESGIPADAGDLDLSWPPEAPPVQRATVVHPGAAGAARRWPPERFAAVARELADAGHDVVVTGVRSEQPLAESVGTAAGLPDDRVLAGRLGLGEMAALVASARLVVCGDTGVAHLATAYRTPSVLLFGPMSPGLWGPPPDRPQHRVVWHGDLAASPAVGDSAHPALLAIEVGEVLAAVDALDAVGALAGSGLSRGQPGLAGRGARP